MTVLLVDVGNSRLKWASLGNGVLSPSRAWAHDNAWTAERLGRGFAGAPAPARVLVASVVGPDAEAALGSFAEQRWGLGVEWVRSSDYAAGVVNGYDKPEQLGVDRWLALIAAHADHSGPTCIADCGTAVTVDVIDAAGRHLGGMILPGVRTMGECVLARTRIPASDPAETGRPFGCRTGEALAIGGLNAVAGAIGRSLETARGILGVVPRLLLAGGDAGWVAEAMGLPVQLRPDLVIEGLAILAEEMDA